jgi:hypothetical protein
MLSQTRGESLADLFKQRSSVPAGGKDAGWDTLPEAGSKSGADKSEEGEFSPMDSIWKRYFSTSHVKCTEKEAILQSSRTRLLQETKPDVSPLYPFQIQLQQ